MNTAVVLWPNSAPLMSIDLSVAGPNGEELLHKSMARDPKESCQKTLERMRMLFGDGQKREKGKKLSRDEILANVPSASILGADGTTLDASKTNAEVWKAASTLCLGTHTLSVSYNIPTVTSITPPSTMTVGVPAVCGNIAIMFCKEEELDIEWRCEGQGVVSTNRVYFPQSAQVGKGMTFRCKPKAPNAMWTEVALPTVLEPTTIAAAMPRWEHTKQRANASDTNAFRVVTYNILHDRFCTSNFAKTKLYPFAKPEILSMNYRKGTIATELKAYNSDIILLQECGQDIYNSYYVHALRAMGYTSKHFNKAGQTKEGSVIAFNHQRFEVVDGDAVPLIYSTLKKDHPMLAAELDKHPHAKEGMDNMTAMCAIAVLKDKLDPTRLLIVASTHLFYHPDGCHIRALQAYMLASALDNIRTKHEKDGRSVHILVGGDFNFTRITGAYELLTSGKVAAERDCWDKGFRFWWGCHHGLGEGGEEEIVEEATVVDNAEAGESTSPVPAVNTRKPPTEVFRFDLSLPNNLSFVDTHRNEPTLKFTNYGMTFKEVIDHIFIGRPVAGSTSESLEVVRTIPLPDEEELSRDVAIPNATYASDHVALVADLTFKKL
eukprot:GILI01018669.1.p1 GENE.GILI01018669.1~~GILI01018669.1.p1  ORF type:complete len:606 (-),score=103.22 GILI01018669.1:48-1865(-)